MKVKRLQKLYSASKGTIRIRSYLEKFKDLQSSSCKAVFGSLEKPFSLDINPEHFTYFESINRGGLMLPSPPPQFYF